MRCPSCESDNVRRLSVVYDEGSYTETSTARTVMTGGGTMMAGSYGGLYTSRSTGTTKTTTKGLSELAKKAAPPEKMRPIRDFLAGLAVLLIGLFLGSAVLSGVVGIPDFLLFVGAVVLFAWTLRRMIARTKHALEFNRSEFPSKLEQWKNSWLCSKCGEIYSMASG